MKKICSLITCLFLLTGSMQAQEESARLSTISLAIVVPESAEGMTAGQLSKLESKITSLVAESGLAATGYTQNFVIYPKFEIYSTKESKGGMRNITVTDCNLSLYIKQVSNNTIFSSYSQRLQGSGFNKDESVENALSQIDPANEAIAAFIQKAKTRIINYYQQNCEMIMQTAERDRMQKKYESAMSILLSIPPEATGCYQKVQNRVQAVFKELQDYNCKKYLQDAKMYAAANNYEDALRCLSWIDPTVSCGNEAKALLNNISKEVDDDLKKRWDLVFKIYDGAIEVAKAKAATMNSLTAYWMARQSRTVTYDVIVH